MRYIAYRNNANTVRIVRDTAKFTWELETLVPFLWFRKRWKRHCYTQDFRLVFEWVRNCDLVVVENASNL